MNFRNVLSFFKRRLTGSKTKFETMINDRNLVVGTASEIRNAHFHIYGAKKGIQNLVIGDDCVIEGSIVLHKNTAKVKIGNRVFIGPNTTLFCYDDLYIQDDVMISWGCTLITTNAHSLKSSERETDVLNWKKGWQHKNWSVVESKPVTIEKKCWIGFNSIITKGVTLREGTVVASGSVVTKSSDPYTIIGGNPAVFIKSTE
jgi:acetyltransferase-like isoleucine patch superfamily enzyme